MAVPAHAGLLRFLQECDVVRLGDSGNQERIKA